ncbi:MAG: hypothetical protein QOG67_326 [Verrucomicrobiota bacterium]
MKNIVIALFFLPQFCYDEGPHTTAITPCSMKPILIAAAIFAISALAKGQTRDSRQLTGSTDFDSGAPKDCLPAAMRVYHSLPGPPTCTWKRLLSARFSNGRPNHVYCVFSLGSQMYAYDTQWGSRKVFPSDRSALSVVRALDFQADQGVYLDDTIKPGPAAITTATQTLTRSNPAEPKKSRSRAKSKDRKSKAVPDRTLQDII